MGVSPSAATPTQIYAIEAINEYHYRKLFSLSKAEFNAEPLEDILINSKIDELVRLKQKKERDILNMRAKHNKGN